MKRLLLFVAVLITAVAISHAAEPDFSIPFAVYGKDTLELDVYMPSNVEGPCYCVIFTYGGGFKIYNQRAGHVKNLCRRLADDGYVAVASNYRLGMEDLHPKNIFALIKPTVNSVKLAAEDILKATAFTLNHAEEWNVRKDGIILCGASAGAMTSLQADYELCNGSPMSKCLPEDFHYAGIVSFAGAVCSLNGKCSYSLHAPAPTLLAQGTSDKIVPYDKIALPGVRISGSNDLAKCFAKNGYPFEIIRYKGEGHSVAAAYITRYFEMTWFLDHMVKAGHHYEIDKTVLDKDHVEPDWGKGKSKQLY